MGFAMFLAAAGLVASAGALPSAPHDDDFVPEDPKGGTEAQLVPEGYRDLANITAVLREWSLLFPERAALYDITDEYNEGRKTAEGRGVYALKISDNVADDEDEPNVLMTGCLHAQELQTPEAILMMAEVLLLATDPTEQSSSRLTEKYNLAEHQLAKLRHAVESQQIWLIAIIVSDGYQFVFDEVPSWRKNRTPNPGGSFGIDLNRNYPQGWFSECSGSTVESSNTFKGPFPASEAETEALINMSDVLRFEKFMDFHSTGREVLANYRCTDYPEELAVWMREKATELGSFADYVYRQPSAEGELFTDYIKRVTSYSFLTEMGSLHRPPYADALEECLRVLPMLIEFLADPVTVFGHVTDAATGAPLPARIERVEFESRFVDSESRFASLPHGRFHVWLPDGLWTLRFSLDEFEGIRYAPETVQVQVVNGQTVELDVQLLEEEASKK
jgi:hypothetical protein